MNTPQPFIADRPARPAPNEPGTLGEQLATIAVAIALGERRGTSAATEWHRARRLVLPHVRGRLDAQGRPR